jgi:hypothetical protein
MRRLFAAVVLTGVLGMGALALPGTAAATSCGHYAKGDLSATGVGCGKARSIIRAYLKQSKPNVTVFGFNCHGSQTVVKCTRPGKSVRWKAPAR